MGGEERRKHKTSTKAENKNKKTIGYSYDMKTREREREGGGERRNDYVHIQMDGRMSLRKTGLHAPCRYIISRDWKKELKKAEQHKFRTVPCYKVGTYQVSFLRTSSLSLVDR